MNSKKTNPNFQKNMEREKLRVFDCTLTADCSLHPKALLFWFSKQCFASLIVAESVFGCLLGYFFFYFKNVVNEIMLQYGSY